MHTLQARRRRSRSQRAVALALAFVVNAGIAAFIDRFAGASPHSAEMASARPAAASRG